MKATYNVSVPLEAATLERLEKLRGATSRAAYMRELIERAWYEKLPLDSEDEDAEAHAIACGLKD